MGRVYTVSFEATAVAAQADLFEISPADDKPCKILGMTLCQTSDVGDAADEVCKFAIIRGHATSGSGGSAATPYPVEATDATVGFSAEVCNTTIASTGTGVTLFADGWNVRSGYQVWFPPECQPVVSQANTTLVVRQAAPADSITMSGTLFVEEMG